MTSTRPWRPMQTAPRRAERIWLNHLTLGPIQAEGRDGRWYAPSLARQVWRWHRPSEPGGLEPFTGWLPFEALAAEGVHAAAAPAEAPGGRCAAFGHPAPGAPGAAASGERAGT